MPDLVCLLLKIAEPKFHRLGIQAEVIDWRNALC